MTRGFARGNERRRQKDKKRQKREKGQNGKKRPKKAKKLPKKKQKGKTGKKRLTNNGPEIEGLTDYKPSETRTRNITLHHSKN